MGTKVRFISVLLLITPVRFYHVIAQDIPGYNMSNYAGVSGVDVQPASIADMRYKIDITLIGAGIDVNNNYIAIKGKYLRDGSLYTNYDGDFKNHFLAENTDPVKKQVGLNAYVQFPSFALTLNRRSSIAFTWRLRSMLNIDNLNYPIAHLLVTGLNPTEQGNQKLFNGTFNNDHFNINQLSWMEYGMSYARVLYSKGHQFFKIGGRVKLENGLEAAYLYAEKLDYNWKNNDTLSLYNSKIAQGHTANLINYANGNFNPAQALFNSAATSLAFDAGFVYEWRPDYYEFNYRFAAQYSRERRDIPKYKLRLGVSVLDLGYFTFKKADVVNDFNANKPDWNVNALNFGSNKLYGYDTIISHYFGYANTIKKFNFYLPTSFSVQADYQLYKDFYLNFTTFISPHWLNLYSQVHSLSYTVITPRWDSKWFGAFVPLGINGYGQFTAGLTLRLGPIIVGTGNGLNLLFANKIYGANAYAAIKIPILYPNPLKKSNKGRDDCPHNF